MTTYITSAQIAEIAAPERTATLRAMLREQRETARTAPAGNSAHLATAANIRNLEAAIERSERNDDARAANEADIAARKQAETARSEERREAMAEAETTAIRQQYRAANPGASDAEIDAAVPALVAEHRAQRMRDATAQTRAAIGRML